MSEAEATIQAEQQAVAAQRSVDIRIKHRYEPSKITPGRCGAAMQLSAGRFQCCGKPESRETHNQAHCPVCQHHFTPDDEPLCPRCESYAPEAFEVIVRRLKSDSLKANSFDVLVEALNEINKAICIGDLTWNRKRYADSDPYHPANVKLCAALELVSDGGLIR